jgi:hypothetical protein
MQVSIPYSLELQLTKEDTNSIRSSLKTGKDPQILPFAPVKENSSWVLSLKNTSVTNPKK